MEIRRDKFRKIVTSPFTGQEYAVRRVSLRTYIKEMGVLPMVAAATMVDKLESLESVRNEIRKNAESDPALEGKTVRFALREGIVKDAEHPGIWFGDYDKCPEDCIAFDDLADDATFLSAQIFEFSFNLSGIKNDMEKFFRDAGAGDLGPNGQEVRSEAVVPAAERNN